MSLPGKPNRRQRAAAMLRSLLAAILARVALDLEERGPRVHPRRRKRRRLRRKG